MSEYTAKVIWNRGSHESYINNQYSRGHHWIFDGGLTVPASSSPHIVPLPFSVEGNVDPEEAFIASFTSCYILFFPGIAAKKRWVVDAYTDNAIDVMEYDSHGNMAISKVTLRPKADFSGEKQPTLEQIEKVHHQSHQECFIANSVKTEVCVDVQV